MLRTYAERYRADPDVWRFLWGPKQAQVPLIVDGFRLGVQALPPPTADTAAAGGHSDTNYQVMHSGRFALIDRQGRIRAYYDGRELDPERVVRDIRQLLE